MRFAVVVLVSFLQFWYTNCSSKRIFNRVRMGAHRTLKHDARNISRFYDDEAALGNGSSNAKDFFSARSEQSPRRDAAGPRRKRSFAKFMKFLRKEAIKQDFDRNQIKGFANLPEQHLWYVGMYIAAHKYFGIDERYGTSRPTEADLEFYKKFPTPIVREFHPAIKNACEKTVLACLEEVYSRLEFSGTFHTMLGHGSGVFENGTLKIKLEEPFSSMFELFHYRQSAMYYLCWFTMRQEKALKYTNSAHTCLGNLSDVNDIAYAKAKPVVDARDRYSFYRTRPFTCAQLWFCPDPCFGKKNKGHLLSNVLESPQLDLGNPCRDLHVNPWCSWMPHGNTNLDSLMRNRFNTSCDCAASMKGYEWNPAYEICVDKDECYDGTHNCSDDRVCENGVGTYWCKCRRGFTRNYQKNTCEPSALLSYEGKMLKYKNNKGLSKDDGGFLGFLDSVLGFAGSCCPIEPSWTTVSWSLVVCFAITRTFSI